MIRLGLFLLAVAVLLLAGGLLLPDRVVVERTAVIERPAATVFTLLNGFRTWGDWSPWVVRDPTLEWTRSGPDTGAGAVVDWTGDPARVGVGRQRILASEPWRRVVLASEVAGQGSATLTYRVDGDGLGSRVTWRYESDVADGQGRFGAVVGRYFGWFLSRWVGRDFETGLARLQAFAERLPRADFAGAGIERVTVTAVPVAQVGGIRAAGDSDLETELADAFRAIGRWAVRADVSLGEAPLVLARRTRENATEFTAALPLAGAVSSEPPPPVTLGRTPAGDAACAMHDGPMEDTLALYARLDAWLAAQGLAAGATAWERYLSDPRAASGGQAAVEVCRLIEAG